MVDLETRGVPAVFVASSVFVDAAAAQAKALGLEPAVVFVPHPIQDRTDAEMRALAERAVDAILAQLSPGP
jgi:alkanesulfonate monooxygenase SsuD/methylene tetrahydromethanopterin reductase-like flavin-dependent oxidoreductase (luciferase family)